MPHDTLNQLSRDDLTELVELEGVEDWSGMIMLADQRPDGTLDIVYEGEATVRLECQPEPTGLIAPGDPEPGALVSVSVIEPAEFWVPYLQKDLRRSGDLFLASPLGGGALMRMYSPHGSTRASCNVA